MADHRENAPSTFPASPPASPSAPAPVYELPEWETITHPPKPRESFLGRILPSRAEPDDSLPMSARPSTAAELNQVKEAPRRASILSIPIGIFSTAERADAQPTLAASLRKRLDTALPPHRTYFGRSRRFLFLFILLPAAIFLFVLTPLAIGLGVGLTRRRSSGAQDLPLPSNKDVFTGDLTYYTPGVGACNIQATSDDHVVSVSHIVFDAASPGSNPNENPLCGMQIRITRDYVEAGAGSQSVDVTVVDRCIGCEATDLDLSLAAFTELAPEDSGRVLGNWAWLS
ncbi:hypothetical protein GGS26DRAFT_200692 [Hypomontagnella submonticulosa]|nr:hypothetical protein GGS26DRAFT_200692 [Hypomontagnella submonticulosa]